MTERRVFEWDEAKAQENVRRGRPDFDEAISFDFATAVITEDQRNDYGEIRLQAIGFVAERLHVLVYTERSERIRVISFRKANEREVTRYDREARGRHQDASDR